MKKYLCEFIGTAVLVLFGCGSAAIAGGALGTLGIALAFVHIMGIPLTGTSVNPARSLAPAIFLGGETLKQVWVFIVAPFVGSVIAAFAFKFLNNEK